MATFSFGLEHECSFVCPSRSISAGAHKGVFYPSLPVFDLQKKTPTHKSSGESYVRNVKLRLGMARVMPLDAFRKQALATALSPARKCRPTGFGFHAGTKTVLTFPCSFGRLVSPFHKTKKPSVDLRAVTVGVSMALSIGRIRSRCPGFIQDCQSRRFLK